MGFKHTKKAFKLPLPSREKLTLLALCEFASNDDDTCFPGIALLSEMTSFCERTVQRAIHVLHQLEIIDKTIGGNGNNIYKLYLRGDLRSWYLYLKSKLCDLGYSEKDLQYAFRDSKSYYNNNLKDQLNLKGKDDLIIGVEPPNFSCGLLFSGAKSQILPPGKNPKLERFWLDNVAKFYEGLEPAFPAKERWLLEETCDRVDKHEIAIYEFLAHVIRNWRQIIKKREIKVKDFNMKAYPHIEVLSNNLNDFCSSYADSIFEP